VKWANAISILSLALSGGIFLFVGTGLTSAKDSPATPITVVDASGGTALLDTLLPAGEVGLIVSEESVAKNDVRQAENNATPCVNINEAAEADLITIKGIGPATAAKIIEYRAQKGPFGKKEDILNVKGIGPAKFAQIEGRICL
jgi:competence ComEA-like helix-hairpin-helix protein